MTVPGNQGSVPPRPEWRATLATLVLLLVTLCLCVIVVGARGQGDGVSGAILRRLARVPLLGRLVQPLLVSTPAPDGSVSPDGCATPSPAVDVDLLSPTSIWCALPSWPTGWPWPPGPKDQPAAVPAAQVYGGAPGPADGGARGSAYGARGRPNLSPEERKRQLG